MVVNTGVCALIEDRQVAVFRLRDDRVLAISNFDPFSQAHVLSRGLVGDKGGVVKVASPLYKQSFSLETGTVLGDDTVRVPTYATEVTDGMVRVWSQPADWTIRG